MNTAALEKRKMQRKVMLAKIEDDLKHGKKADPPAYTLILGAGAMRFFTAPSVIVEKKIKTLQWQIMLELQR